MDVASPYFIRLETGRENVEDGAGAVHADVELRKQEDGSFVARATGPGEDARQRGRVGRQTVSFNGEKIVFGG